MKNLATNQLTLYFHKNFPDSSFAGKSVVLIPDANGQMWTFGRKSFQGAFAPDVNLGSANFISRTQFTIKYEVKEWHVRDGVYTPVKETGMWIYSANGTYLNDCRLEMGDWEPLFPDTSHTSARIALGMHPDAKIVAVHDQHDTLDSSVWEGWQRVDGEAKRDSKVLAPENPSYASALNLLIVWFISGRGRGAIALRLFVLLLLTIVVVVWLL